MPRFLVSCASLLLLAASFPGAQSSEPPDTLARRLQERYRNITDFRADFTQMARSGVLRTQSSGAGTVSVKKPGRMRWVYTSPEKKEVIFDGTNVFEYLPDDRLVYEDAAPSGDDAPTAMVFLSGRGDILRDFVPAHVDSPVAGTLALKLTPRQAERDYEYLVVAIDPRSLQIRALVTRDQLGGDSQITFSNLRENAGIPDRTFAFTPPRGVEVIRSAAPR
jgi:outer membrane lipoprotein carrier protein